MTPSEQSYDEVEYAPVSEWGNKSYFISSDGRLFRVMEVLPSYAKGYGVLATFCDVVGKRYRTIHSIVAEAFIGPRPKGLTINHKDGNKCNNSVENLEYMTIQKNIQHAWDTGLNKTRAREFYQRISPKIQRAKRKVSDEDALEMIRLFRAGGARKGELAKRYGISPQGVTRIIKGETVYKELAR